MVFTRKIRLKIDQKENDRNSNPQKSQPFSSSGQSFFPLKNKEARNSQEAKNEGVEIRNISPDTSGTIDMKIVEFLEDASLFNMLQFCLAAVEINGRAIRSE